MVCLQFCLLSQDLLRFDFFNMNLVVYTWDLLLFLSVFSKDLNHKSTVFMWLYLGLYGFQSILLIMNIFILLVKIWLTLAIVCSEAYKNETHLIVFIHWFMKSSLLFFTYFIFLTFIPVKKNGEP